MSYGPNLDDPKLFEKRSGVPILDVHERHGRVVDEAKLRQVAEQSNRRAAAGEFGLLMLGHTTEDASEAQQPPVVGYVRNYRMDRHDGRPCITADLYYEKGDASRLMKNFPRRSVEVYYSDAKPEENYIDGVALLVRSAARPLGLVTYSAEHRQKERYSLMVDAAPTIGVTEDDIAALQDWMKRNSIMDLAAGIKGFLQAKADGSLPGPDDFGQADIEGVQKYARDRKIDLTKNGAYAATVEKYKSEKRAGTLNRYQS